MTVREIYDFINAAAPFDTQESFDNSGLLVGRAEAQVHGVLFALDVTDRVLDEAEACGADLIVTHHPLMFSARKTMTEDDYEGRLLCRMIRCSQSLISAHTNLDRAPGGVNDVLAALCGLTNVTGEGFIRIGDLPAGVTAGTLPQLLSRSLSTTVRVMGQQEADTPLHRLAVSSGAGSDSWAEALRLGADVFLSGEMKHHHALALNAGGVLALEAGHFATEEPGIFALADALQNWLDAVQCKVHVSKSRSGAYAPPVSM